MNNPSSTLCTLAVEASFSLPDVAGSSNKKREKTKQESARKRTPVPPGLCCAFLSCPSKPFPFPRSSLSCTPSISVHFRFLSPSPGHDDHPTHRASCSTPSAISLQFLSLLSTLLCKHRLHPCTQFQISIRQPRRLDVAHHCSTSTS